MRLPDGRLKPLDHVTATYVREADGDLVGSTSGAGGRHAIVLAVKPLSAVPATQ